MDLAPFDENRPEFKGFNRFYEKNIELRLIGLDQERRKRVKNMWAYGIGGTFAAVAVAATIAYFSGHPGFAIFSFIAGLFVAWGAAYTQITKATEQSKELILGEMMSFLGWGFRAKGFAPLPIDLFRKYDMLPRYDRLSTEDMISGEGHGARFLLHELHLEQRRKSKNSETWVTMFRGIIMELKFPRDFEGTTLLLRDKGWLNAKEKQGLKRVGLEDPHFEKIFEAYGDDQVTSRVLLDPIMMQALVDLERAFGGSKIRALFKSGSVWIAFEAKNQFEPGSMFTPLQDRGRIRKLLKEVGEIFDLIDGIVNTHATKRPEDYAQL